MKVLSIKQPWLYCIIELDKRIENRSWAPPERMIGERIALHASLKIDKQRTQMAHSLAKAEIPPDLPRGVIVATAVLLGVVSDFCVIGDIPTSYSLKDDRWFFGKFGWYLGKIIKLSNPIPARGYLGLWNLPNELQKKINHF
ncbi:MAG: hypothetical protein Q8L64_00710 [bacterium]|nr:hypothetical protein [bacterium]